jgi:hypothetical protein
MPDISVIVRSMDRAVLARALASVAAQGVAGGAHAEVIVVAASGPGHRPVARRAGRFPCRLVPGDEPLSRARAANAGLEAARGRLVTFLDDDDELLPGHFAAMRGAFLADPRADFVHARSHAVDPGGKLLYVYGGPWVPWRQLTHGFFQLGAVMFRRGLVDRGVRFDERLEILEDLEFFVQCAQVGRFHYLPVPVSRYYVMDGSSGTGDGVNRDDARVQRALAHIQEKWSTLARELAATAPARVARAQELLRRGGYQAALMCLAPLLDTTPEDINALNLGALAHIQLGHFETAESLLKAALGILPGHPGLRSNLELLERRRTTGS